MLYLVPGIWYLVPVPGTWYTWYLVYGTWYLYLVPGTYNHVVVTARARFSMGGGSSAVA